MEINKIHQYDKMKQHNGGILAYIDERINVLEQNKQLITNEMLIAELRVIKTMLL